MPVLLQGKQRKYIEVVVKSDFFLIYYVCAEWYIKCCLDECYLRKRAFTAPMIEVQCLQNSNI